MTEYTLWGSSGGNNNADDGTNVSLGTKMLTSASVPLWCLGIRYYRGTLSAGTKTAKLWRTSDQVSFSETVTFTDGGTGWQEKRFVTPVALALATYYTPSVLFPSGQPSYTNNYFTTGGPGASGITNGPISAPNTTTASGQGVYIVGGTLACPTNTFNATNYWIDWIVTDVNPFARSGTGATSATAALASIGRKSGRGTAALTATGALAAVGRKDTRGTAALTASAAPASTGRKATGGTGALTAAAAPASAGLKAATGTGAATAASALAETGSKTATGTAALAGTALLGETGTAARSGTGSLVGTATPAETGTAARSGTGGLTATALLTASGNAGERSGTGTLAATAVLASAGQANRNGSAALTAVATLAATGHNPGNLNAAQRFSASPPYTRGRAYPPRT